MQDAIELATYINVSTNYIAVLVALVGFPTSVFAGVYTFP